MWYSVGEVRGDHYWLGTAGYLREIGRMPDFLGGAAHVGVWFENGDAFDDWDKLSWRTHVTTGLIVDTLIGPMLLGGSGGFDGRWRTYVGIGRLFRYRAGRTSRGTRVPCGAAVASGAANAAPTSRPTRYTSVVPRTCSRCTAGRCTAAR